LKKIAKFTGDVPLCVCQVKPHLKPTNPQADPCPSLSTNARLAEGGLGGGKIGAPHWTEECTRAEGKEPVVHYMGYRLRLEHTL